MTAARQHPRISTAEFAAVMRDLVPYVGQLDIRVQRLDLDTISLLMPTSDLTAAPGRHDRRPGPDGAGRTWRCTGW